MPERQYVRCKFRSTDTRSYTYHNDGEPVAPGDMVKVPDRDSDAWKRVEVVAIVDEEPPFPTKAILGKVDPEPTGELDIADTGAGASAALGDDADLAPTF